MDFLLECIGFPPNHDLDSLARLIRKRGESVAWRGPSGVHLRVPFGNGIEVRLDREDGQSHETLWPHFEVQRRLRVAFQSKQPLPDSPYDMLLHGIANPPLPVTGPGSPAWDDGPGLDYAISTYVSDARRLPKTLPVGHILALSVCGFALDISYVGPNQGVRDPFILEEPRGASLLPVAADVNPGGCMDLSLRVRRVRHMANPITGERVELVEADAPGRPLDLFLSHWQLEADGHPTPRPGWRIEGAFLFTGRVSGGLPPRRLSRGR